jgi:GTPase Era involved in 16S rRNA processing
MAQNIFEEIQGKKQSLLSLAQKAVEFGWIPKQKSSKDEKGATSISYEEIVEKIENDTLTIGVIGQMKCGKSTFLNSFVFEDTVLPAATTPMTAALSVITYGEKERIVAEFYTPDEWAEQKQQAARSLDDVANSLDESKVKAAKELVSKASKLGSSLESLLGTIQEDNFENLIEYVGAEGRYVSITKSVKIYYPKEYLKGVEIVDTPGFNDPIVSREERTKDFLKKADVVLMMLYAGRPFDATDRDIIFKNVRQCGIGKVLVGINKYDIPYCNEHHPEDEQQIKEYVKEEIRKACRECSDNLLVEILRDVEPIPLSAEMALLSELPMSKISSTEALDFAWKRHCSGFGISSQQEMRHWSRIDILVDAVKELVYKEKGKILFAKPLNAIIAAGNRRKEENKKDLTLLNSEIEILSMPDDEIEEKEVNLAKANKRLTKKINSLGDDLEAELHNLVRQGKNELEDIVDTSCGKMKSIIHNEWSRMKSFESVRPRLDAEMQNLYTRQLKRAVMNITVNGKNKINRCVIEFFEDAEDLLMRFLPDFDSRDFVKSTKNKIQLEMDDSDLFTYESGTDDEDFGLGEFFFAFLNGASWGMLGLAGNILTHGDEVAKVEDVINRISAEFDPTPFLESAIQSKDRIIEQVQNIFINELIEPLQEQIQEIRSQKADKETRLIQAREKLSVAEQTEKVLNAQIEEISNMREG